MSDMDIVLEMTERVGISRVLQFVGAIVTVKSSDVLQENHDEWYRLGDDINNISQRLLILELAIKKSTLPPPAGAP